MKRIALSSLIPLLLVFLAACKPSETATPDPAQEPPATPETQTEPAPPATPETQTEPAPSATPETQTEPETSATPETSGAPATQTEPATKSGPSKAYFASGCFWCVEAVYESVRGVDESISGYSGGHTKNPTYESSNTGQTGHAEAVEIIYDPDVVSFSQLVDVYFGSQDITQVNGQGPDRGSRSRSIIFYQNAEEKEIIDAKIRALNEELGGEKVAAEVMPFEKFWIAEDYHQNYEKLHPNDSYVRGVSVPRLKKFLARFPELLKEGVAH